MRHRTALDVLRSEASHRRARVRPIITSYQVALVAVVAAGLVLVVYAKLTMP